MTTISQLPVAPAAATTDLVPLSQNGVLRAASLAQITAGLQSQIALATGQLVGRVSTGTGPAEPITIGANLSLSNGTLAATPMPFNVAALPAGVPPSLTDLVAIGQQGANRSLPYSQFMAGLAGLQNLDISQLATTPTATTVLRRLADQMSDSLPIEAFGAVGDGVADDSNALIAALASQRPVRLAAKTYLIAGQITISRPNTFLIGIPGQTVLRRLRQDSGSAWFAIQGTGFQADGIIFDANKAVIAADSWNVLITSTCLRSDWHRCGFTNAAGNTLGHGLAVQASDPAIVQHVIRDCEFANNTLHGLWVQACAGVLVEGCRAHDNGQYGLNLDFNDAALAKKFRLSQVIGNRAWNNLRGIAVGNFNATNTQVPVWGNANPDALSVIVSNNLCHDNVVYGIAVSGRSLLVHANLCSNNGSAANSGADILANLASSRVTANMLTGSGLFGIDCGGSVSSEIGANHVIGHSVGINCGGSTALRVAGNTIQDATGWAILVENVETDSFGQNFAIACSQLALTGNWLAMTSAGASGILLRNGPQGVLVARNDFVGSNGAQLANCLWANTDQVIVEENRWNFTQRFFANPTLAAGLQTVLLPDIADSVMISSAPSGVQSMLTLYQNISAGQLTFIRVTASGTGYTTASVAVSGAGSGAAARAIISNGGLLGIVVTAPGTGYGSPGSTWPVIITGDGSGATATATTGVPIPDERRIRIRCNTGVRFARGGSSPVQENWTGTDINVAANADIEWIGTFNTWRASFFSSADYLAPDSQGGASLRSVGNADIQIRPAGSGRFRLTTDAEAVGCIEAIGRNAPEGAVTAPPGSTFRNLNGGVGTTLYVKRSGTGPTGWFALG